MASQVLSGTSNVSYTNNTGQNVRIVINFMSAPVTGNSSFPFGVLAMSWAGVSLPTGAGQFIIQYAIGRGVKTPDTTNATAPTELMLAPGQTFTATCGPYNIVVIPEGG